MSAVNPAPQGARERKVHIKFLFPTVPESRGVEKELLPKIATFVRNRVSIALQEHANDNTADPYEVRVTIFYKPSAQLQCTVWGAGQYFEVPDPSQSPLTNRVEGLNGKFSWWKWGKIEIDRSIKSLDVALKMISDKNDGPSASILLVVDGYFRWHTPPSDNSIGHRLFRNGYMSADYRRRHAAAKAVGALLLSEAI